MARQFVVRLRRQGANGPIVANSQVITITDSPAGPISSNAFRDLILQGRINTLDRVANFIKQLTVVTTTTEAPIITTSTTSTTSTTTTKPRTYKIEGVLSYLKQGDFYDFKVSTLTTGDYYSIVIKSTIEGIHPKDIFQMFVRSRDAFLNGFSEGYIDGSETEKPNHIFADKVVWNEKNTLYLVFRAQSPVQTLRLEIRSNVFANTNFAKYAALPFTLELYNYNALILIHRPDPIFIRYIYNTAPYTYTLTVDKFEQGFVQESDNNTPGRSSLQFTPKFTVSTSRPLNIYEIIDLNETPVRWVISILDQPNQNPDVFTAADFQTVESTNTNPNYPGDFNFYYDYTPVTVPEVNDEPDFTIQPRFTANLRAVADNIIDVGYAVGRGYVFPISAAPTSNYAAFFNDPARLFASLDLFEVKDQIGQAPSITNISITNYSVNEGSKIQKLVFELGSSHFNQTTDPNSRYIKRNGVDLGGETGGYTRSFKGIAVDPANGGIHSSIAADLYGDYGSNSERIKDWMANIPIGFRMLWVTYDAMLVADDLHSTAQSLFGGYGFGIQTSGKAKNARCCGIGWQTRGGGPADVQTLTYASPLTKVMELNVTSGSPSQRFSMSFDCYDSESKTIYWFAKPSSGGLDALDFVGPSTGNFDTVANQKKQVTIVLEIKTDFLTEGPENFKIALSKTQNVDEAFYLSDDITIEDTSTTRSEVVSLAPGQSNNVYASSENLRYRVVGGLPNTTYTISVSSSTYNKTLDASGEANDSFPLTVTSGRVTATFRFAGTSNTRTLSYSVVDDLVPYIGNDPM